MRGPRHREHGRSPVRFHPVVKSSLGRREFSPRGESAIGLAKGQAGSSPNLVSPNMDSEPSSGVVCCHVQLLMTR